MVRQVYSVLSRLARSEWGIFFDWLSFTGELGLRLIVNLWHWSHVKCKMTFCSRLIESLINFKYYYLAILVVDQRRSSSYSHCYCQRPRVAGSDEGFVNPVSVVHEVHIWVVLINAHTPLFCTGHSDYQIGVNRTKSEVRIIIHQN